MLERFKRKIQIIPAILCGAFITGLWPLSQAFLNKQFLSLAVNKSLFHLTVKLLFALDNDDIKFCQAAYCKKGERR